MANGDGDGGRARVTRDVAPAASELIHKIESTLPTRCETGPGRLHLVRGYCFHPLKRTSALKLLLGEHSIEVEEFEDFRPDVAQEFAARDEVGSSLSSGFFTSFEAAPELAGSEQTLALDIRFDDGSRERLELGGIRFVAPGPQLATVPAARLAICLATWNPDPEVFARQVDSLIAQDFTDWVCIINDDGSARAIYALIQKICARDPRFHVFRSERNLGFYRNFELALSRVPAGSEFVALCDQDDVWNPDKLSASVAAFKQATQLVYSDMRIVKASGEVVSPTYWARRRNQYTELDVLITANTVTGAASVFRAGLLVKVLPLPEPIGDSFHDHWIACCALAGGGIEYVDRPLYDYMQYGTNVIGHATFDKVPTLRRRLLRAGKGIVAPWNIWPRLAEIRFASLDVVKFEYRRMRLIAETLRTRFAPGPELHHALTPFLAANPWGIALALRHFSPGFSRDTTGNAELRLAFALAIRRLSQIYVRLRARRSVMRLRSAGRPLAEDEKLRDQLEDRMTALSRKIRPLMLDIDAAAPRRVNLLIPEINFKNFFGGYIGKFNLARKLAEQGYQVRIVIVDWCDVQPALWRKMVSRYEGLAGLFNYIEVAYCFDRAQPLLVNADDAFIASTWWTAHIADDAMRQLARHGNAAAAESGFIYLIQEYEPFTFPMGTLYSAADQSYGFRHRAIFSTALLQDYFRQHTIGVYAARGAGDGGAVYFENAILKFEPTREKMAGHHPRKLLFYLRPDAHAARNMFEIGMLALEQARAGGAFAGANWEFHGVGSEPGLLAFDSGIRVKSLGKLSLDEYQDILPEYDIGLSLMYTPHPSLVPLEMAAAGMLAVTNTCLNKTADKLATISGNLIAAAPTIDGVAAAIAEAALRSGDFAARLRGSQVNWASDWDSAFNAEILTRIVGWLGPPGAAH